MINLLKSKVAEDTCESAMTTLQQIENKILDEQGKCAECNRPIQNRGIRSYDHSDGNSLEDFPEKQWVFFRCPFCGYDSALWKVVQAISYTS